MNKLQKAGLVVAGFFASSVAMAAPPDVKLITADIDGAAAPIAAVAGSSLGIYVGLRVWKMVRRAI